MCRSVDVACHAVYVRVSYIGVPHSTCLNLSNLAATNTYLNLGPFGKAHMYLNLSHVGATST